MSPLPALVLILAQATASPAPSPDPVASADFSAPADFFEIDNSGSSATLGYTVLVRRDGEVRYVVAAPRRAPGEEPQNGTRTVDRSLAEHVLADLAALTPFPPAQEHCIQSVSSGPAITVVWKGQRSPPLDCPGNPDFSGLRADVMAIVSQLKLRTLRAPALIGGLPRSAPSP